MLHFFINTGIKDTAYYWNELSKCMNVYCELKAICPELDSLNIGGGFPIKNSLNFEYDYEYLTEEIVAQIKNICQRNGIEEPNIFTEFGSFTVGESGAALYSIVNQKQQNDRENWYMIDSSFITTLPDTWGINQRYIMLAVNNWDKEYQRVLLGGLTCDSEDFYNAECAHQRHLPAQTRSGQHAVHRIFPHGSLPGVARRLRRHPALPDPRTQARDHRPRQVATTSITRACSPRSSPTARCCAYSGTKSERPDGARAIHRTDNPPKSPFEKGDLHFGRPVRQGAILPLDAPDTWVLSRIFRH